MAKLKPNNVKFTRSVGTTRLPNTAVYDTATLVKTIDNPNLRGGTNNDYFGYVLHTDGSHIIVSSPYEIASNGQKSGIAYIFDMDGNRIHSIENPNTFSTPLEDEFGNACAIDGNYAIVGAWGEDASGTSSVGKAYIYNVTTGALVRTLATPVSGGGYVGMTVAISGDNALTNFGGTDGGVKVYSIATGAEIRTLSNPNLTGGSAGDYFGYDKTLHAHGDNVLVTAWAEDAVGSNAGSAYVFDLPTGNLLYSFSNPNIYSTPQNDYFGKSGDINEKYAAIGSWQEDDPTGTNSGAVYVYDLADGSLKYSLANPNATGTAGGDRFGYDVALHGDYLVVGAMYDEGTSVESGTVYVYDLLTGNLIITIDNPNGYGANNTDGFGSGVEITNNKVIVAAMLEDDATGAQSGKVYIFDLSTA